MNNLLRTQALCHFGAALVAISAFAAIDSWLLVSNLALAKALGFIVAIASGIALSHLIHEWGHFVGAVITKSAYTIKENISPLFFDFDYLNNNKKQYLTLSAGGPIGNVLIILMTACYLPMDNLIRATFMATLIGQFIYVLFLESPISIGILKGKDPLETLANHFGQGKPLFVKCTLYGVIAGIICLVIIY